MIRVFKWLGLTVLALTVLGVAFLVYQGGRKPSGEPQYVALGSSFAAGLGLGSLSPGSPIICQRSANGYPQRLARSQSLSLVDMSCSGATVAQVLRGGQVFQGPQIGAIGPNTRLVTLTAGGNDIAYVGDLVSLSYGNRGAFLKAVMQAMAPAPHSPASRNLAQVGADIRATVRAVRARAPSAFVVVTTYPTILPETGTCPALGLTEEQVAGMRPVAALLAQATRAAALSEGATVVDMAILSRGHDACSAVPWTNGSAPAKGAPFHPTNAGAAATAVAVGQAGARRCRAMRLRGGDPRCVTELSDGKR